MSQIQYTRQVVFDTETTGMNENGPVYMGHRVIEIGCVEVINRKLTGRTFHEYIKPDRLVDSEAIAIHGLTDDFLADKPRFSEIVDSFIEFISGAELIAHNAGFDISFINHEFSILPSGEKPKVETFASVTDTLMIARRGEYDGREVQQVLGKPLPSRKSLDSLCNYYGVDGSARTFHGALLDAELLAEVFLKMTGGQSKLNLTDAKRLASGNAQIMRLSSQRPPLKVLGVTKYEAEAHEERLDIIDKEGGSCLWRQED